ncbi:hypothetical protein CPB86DRAFT_102450 [Serendipita vermifera]|nr:hypothetical protein CPB86DRAFT_102450 [Serendipita vermifera]
MSEPYPRNTYPASQSAAPASNGHAPSSHQELSVSLPYMSGTNDDYPVHQSLSTNEHVDTQDLASVSMLSPVDPTVLSYPSPTTPFTAIATSSDPINPPENNTPHQYADRNVQATIYQSTLFKSIIPTPTTSQFLLACLAPSQPTGLPEGELILFPHLFPSWSSSFTHDSSSPTEHHSIPSSSSSKSRDLRMLETVLLTAILLVVNKGEWTRVQSLVDPLALQAVFMAEARGDVPPYTPGATGMRRLAQRQGGSYPYPRVGTGNSTSSPVDAEMAEGRTRERANSGPLERPRVNLAEEARLANARHAKSAGDGASHQLSTPPITVQRRQSHRTSHSTPSSARGPDTNPFPTPPFAFPLRVVGSRRGAGRPSVDGHGNNSTGIRTAPTTSSGHSRAGDGFFTSRRPSTSHGRARDTAIESRPSGNQDQNETVSRNRTVTRGLDFTGSRSTRSRPSSSGGRRPSTTEVRAGDGFFSTSRRTVVPSNDRESTRPTTATLLNLSYSQDAPIPPTRSPPPDYEQFATAGFKDGGIKG